MAEPVLIPGWTLNYEMAFYALFALGLAWPARRLAVLASGLLGAILAGMLLPDSAAIRFYGSPIILEFLAGALLAEAMGRGFVLPRGACAALIAAGAIGLAVEPWGWLGIAGRGAPLPAALALVAGAILWERAAPWPHWRWLHLLGDASYALYLVHTLALAALAIGWRLASLPASLPLLALAGLVVSVATGLATHLWIEIPLRRAVQRRRNGGAAAGPPPG
jgi:exopolysaccharide production protein ExoZ